MFWALLAHSASSTWVSYISPLSTQTSLIPFYRIDQLLDAVSPVELSVLKPISFFNFQTGLETTAQGQK